jgi:hypothetical protein
MDTKVSIEETIDEAALEAEDTARKSKWFSSLPTLPQRQDSLLDQLRDLQAVANRLGMYDAADFLSTTLRRIP